MTLKAESSMSSNPLTTAAKRRAAEAAAALVQNGMAVGLGTGTTAELVIRALSERIAEEGLKFLGVPTSVETAELASTLRIPLRELDDVDVLDLNLDGADEIDPEFRMIKGRGGALLREKLVVTAARRRVTVITEEKQVARLGLNALIPVEVSPIGSRHTEKRLEALGAETKLRVRPDGEPVITDGGNRIIDCRFESPDDPTRLDANLKQVVGVFETGIFIGLCDLLIVGGRNGVTQIESTTSWRV
jgi:ribose 5-phosphate isomerase A